MNSSRLVDDEGTLARVSCGNSRVRAPGFASLHLCVNIQFPRPAWRDAGRKELSAVEISVGGLGSALGLGPWGHHTWISSATHRLPCQKRPLSHFHSGSLVVSESLFGTFCWDDVNI